jgi:hypothetical protein
MASGRRGKLKNLLANVRPGVPLRTDDLARAGISSDLAIYYARSGWLDRLGRGVYALPGEPLLPEASLVALEREIPGLHVGGKTALDWQGFRHYLRQRSALDLYGWVDAHLPVWFNSRFPSEYHRKRLFDEQPDALLGVARFEGRDDAPLTSKPERALLEVLSEVGVRQSLSEVRELTQGMYSLRADVLTSLLEHCRSVKTVRLCLKLAREFKLPWEKKLNRQRLPTGSDQPWVARSRDGLLVLEP